MAQKANFEKVHFNFRITVDLRQVYEVPTVPPNEYLTAKEIAKELHEKTGENWTYHRVMETLAQMGYITKLKPNWPWQPTEKAKHYADFNSGIIKWSPEVINLILQQQPQQLRLAV